MVCNEKPYMFPNVKIVYPRMTKLNEIDGLFIIIMKVFKFTFMFLVSRMWPVLRVNRRFKNLSWYLRENHSCLQLKGYHVTSTVTKLNDIDGLSIITIYVFKLIFMVLIPKMGSCFLEYIDGFFPKWEIVKNHSVI